MFWHNLWREVEKNVSPPRIHSRINTTHHVLANVHGLGVLKVFNWQLAMALAMASFQLAKTFLSKSANKISTVFYCEISDVGHILWARQKDSRLADQNKGMSLRSDTWLFQRHLNHLTGWVVLTLSTVEDIEQLIKKLFDGCWSVAILVLQGKKALPLVKTYHLRYLLTENDYQYPFV